MLDRWLNFILPLLRWIPAFAAALIFSTRLPPGLREGYYRNYATFLTVLLVAALDLLLIRHYQIAQETRRSGGADSAEGRKTRPPPVSRREIWLQTGIVTVTAGLLFLLGFSKDRLPDSTLYLLLFTLGLDPISHSLLTNGLISPGFAVRLLRHTLVGYISFEVALFNWEWQPFLFALGIGAPLVAVEIAECLTGGSVIGGNAPAINKAKPRDAMMALRGYASLLVAGPVLISMLAGLGQLPTPYTLACLMVPLTLRLVKSAQTCNDPKTLPAGFLRETAGVYLLFVVIIAAFGLAASRL